MWASVDILVDYDSDIDEVQRLAVAAMQESTYLAPYEDPQFWVMGLQEHAVRCMVASWANSPGDRWMVLSDTRANLVPKLKAAGIRSQVYEHRPAGAVAPELVTKAPTRAPARR